MTSLNLLSTSPALIRKGIFRGLDLNVLAARWWRLEAMRVDAERPVPMIRFRAYRGSGMSGIARVRYRGVACRHITLCIGEHAPVEEVLEVLLHELVHCACPLTEHHGGLFQRRLIACAREAFGLELDTEALLALPPLRECVAYAIDAHIMAKMMRIPSPSSSTSVLMGTLFADPSLRFFPPPPVPEATLLARREAARQARSAAKKKHCEKMLATWQARLARAKTTERKWRKRVAYYEKLEIQVQAAKKRGG